MSKSAGKAFRSNEMHDCVVGLSSLPYGIPIIDGED